MVLRWASCCHRDGGFRLLEERVEVVADGDRRAADGRAYARTRSDFLRWAETAPRESLAGPGSTGGAEAGLGGFLRAARREVGNADRRRRAQGVPVVSLLRGVRLLRAARELAGRRLEDGTWGRPLTPVRRAARRRRPSAELCQRAAGVHYTGPIREAARRLGASSYECSGCAGLHLPR